MSTITEFLGSFGSSSPKALPTIFSYWPTPGHEYPPKVGDSLVVIWILVVCASAAGEKTSATTAANTAQKLSSRIRGAILCTSLDSGLHFGAAIIILLMLSAGDNLLPGL